MDSIRETDIIALGFGSNPQDLETLRDFCANENPRFRQLAISALIRRDPENAFTTWQKLVGDPDWKVRRRMAELGINFGIEAAPDILKLLKDDVSLVKELASFAAGEIYESISEVQNEKDETLVEVISCLSKNAKDDDPLVRESAVASLGNIGDEETLEIILEACNDKAPIRRRAVVALAAFSGDKVDQALDKALKDNDWQVRQAAEDISGKKSPRE